MLGCTLAAFLILTPQATQQTAPPRDAATAKPAAGATIRGRVTAAATGQPLHRAKLTFNGGDGASVGPFGSPSAPTAVTDTRGRFELTDVPPGTYSISITRAGYLPLQYGQRRPREPGRTLTVQSGQTLENLDVALQRGGVLSGRITDDTGEPFAGARVEAIELRHIRGRRVSVPARQTSTNDAGEYRLGNLEPGRYQIRASTVDVWPSDDGKGMLVYATTWFPGVTGADPPESVDVAMGREVGALDFHLIPGRPARITGDVLDAQGAPMPDQAVNLDRIDRTVGGALLSAGFGGRAKTDASGRFEIRDLPPGEFMAYTGGPDDRVAVQGIVGEGESRHIVLSPRKPAALIGAVTTDEGTPPPFSPSRVNIDPIPANAAGALPVWNAPRTQSPAANWTFKYQGIDGEFYLRMTGLPPGWMLKAVTLGGRDVIDSPIRIVQGGPDVDGVQLVLSRKGAQLSGDVVTSSGAATGDGTVIVFSENPSQWGVASRYVKAVRPDEHGHFSIGGLTPGVYRVVVNDGAIDGQWEDATFLQSLLRDAARIELKEGATETVKLVLEASR